MSDVTEPAETAEEAVVAPVQVVAPESITGTEAGIDFTEGVAIVDEVDAKTQAELMGQGFAFTEVE